MPLALCLVATGISESYTRNLPVPDRSQSIINDNAQSYSVSFRLDEIRSYEVGGGFRRLEVPGIEIRDPNFPCYTQTSDKTFPTGSFINSVDCADGVSKPIPPRQSTLYFQVQNPTLPLVLSGTFQLSMHHSANDTYEQDGKFFRYQIEITP